MSKPETIPNLDIADNHEYIIRAQNLKRKVNEYKKYFTFKHNML